MDPAKIRLALRLRRLLVVSLANGCGNVFDFRQSVKTGLGVNIFAQEVEPGVCMVVSNMYREVYLYIDVLSHCVPSSFSDPNDCDTDCMRSDTKLLGNLYSLKRAMRPTMVFGWGTSRGAKLHFLQN